MQGGALPRLVCAFVRVVVDFMSGLSSSRLRSVCLTCQHVLDVGTYRVTTTILHHCYCTQEKDTTLQLIIQPIGLMKKGT